MNTTTINGREYVEIDFDRCNHVAFQTGSRLLRIGDDDVWVPEWAMDPDELPDLGDENESTLVLVDFAEENGLV